MNVMLSGAKHLTVWNAAFTCNQFEDQRSEDDRE